MGYSIGWLAVHSREPEAVYQALQVQPTETPDEYFNSPLAGVTLNTGWILFVAQGSERLIAPRIMGTISARWPCVGCLVEEHVMCSSASFWRNGAQVWSIVHHPDNGILDLDATGDLPESFTTIRDETMRKQAEDGDGENDVDYVFDIPLQIAKQLTGFKHDESLGPSLAHSKPVTFTDLAPKKRGWWRW